MIKVYLDVSESLIEKVNHNLYLMLELFLEDAKQWDYGEYHQVLFPDFYFRKNRNRCVEIVTELFEWTQDRFTHELEPIYEYALFSLINWWLEVTEVNFEQEVKNFEAKRPDDEYLIEHLNDIEEYKAFLFQDWDFNDVPNLFEIYKKSPEYFYDLMHTNLDHYIDLMPEKIKEEYEKIKANYETTSNNSLLENDLEMLIVKEIYNAIHLREQNPKRLKETSETDLSDDISHVLQRALIGRNLTISREMPSGFAKEKVGELDFYITQQISGVYKIIAVGENKEWGNLERQLKQLLGYMKPYGGFGFIIIFNKRTRLNTVVKSRRKILNDFHVEIHGVKHFELCGEIREVKGLDNVLITTHKNPEIDDSFFNIYHFIVNANLDERENAAVQARS